MVLGAEVATPHVGDGFGKAKNGTNIRRISSEESASCLRSEVPKAENARRDIS